jgi:tRNA(fMet)-specific endonuclease VapC
MNYLLDTNIVSLALKQNSQILHKITISESKEEKIFISCITYFEIRRGFLGRYSMNLISNQLIY